MSTTGRIAGLAACVLALALPAVASAEPNWVRVLDPAPGGRLHFDDWIPMADLAVAGRTPYIATESVSGELTVWRPNAAGDRWIQAGDAVNHVPLGFDVFKIGADGNTPWIAWTEHSADGATETHVARLVHNRWVEPAGGWPAGDGDVGRGDTPELVLFDGRPYVTIDPTAAPWASHPQAAVTRLSSDGTKVEPVTDGLPDGCTPNLAVSSGRLYAGCGKELLRLNDDETAWESVATHSEPFRLVDATGTLYLLGASGGHLLNSHDQIDEDPNVPSLPEFIDALAGFQGRPWIAFTQSPPYPDFVGPVQLAAADQGLWLSAPAPDLPNHGAQAFRLIEDADGNLWLSWWSSPYNTVSEPFEVHVARFAEQGEAFDFAPDPAEDHGQPPADHSGAPGTGDDDGFTTPDGTPATPPVAQPPRGRGACANSLVGTVRGERLVGSLLGDRIRGLGGADHLFGRSGSDCIWGGSGNDFVSGGGSADSLSGGRGSDRIVPGGGRDDVAAGSGADVINAVGGGVDRVNCGSGRDTVKLSPNDLIKGCERVVVVRR